MLEKKLLTTELHSFYASDLESGLSDQMRKSLNFSTRILKSILHKNFYSVFSLSFYELLSFFF